MIGNLKEVVKLRIFVFPRTFQTAFVARTSRGSVTQRRCYFLFLEAQGSVGIGEGSPLPGLSLDGDREWQQLIGWLETNPELPELLEGRAYSWAQDVALAAGVGRASSLLFALESAALSLLSGQPELYYPSTFTAGSRSLEINGLVWMDTLDAMRRQADEKVNQGFTTIKFKIGSFDWSLEKELLKDFRKAHPADLITIRVDANGAYSEDQALRVMEDLYPLKVHSIEQPIMAGNPNKIRRLALEGSTLIALDEELISPMPKDELVDMLDYVNAPYLVLKPTLIGGFSWSTDLIALAEKKAWQWWLTSSLETPIGLTALAQFAATYAMSLPHGLSTGKIFSESFRHPNVLEGNRLHFDPASRFDFTALRRPDLGNLVE